MPNRQQNTEKFKKITTGNEYQNDLIATNINRLEMTVDALNHLEDVLSKELLFTRDGIDKLEDTIKKANNKNDKLQKWFLVFTIIGGLSTLIQLIPLLTGFINWICKII